MVERRVVSASTPTAVVADSTSGLPAELLGELDVRIVSLYVGLEGEQERETEITDLDEFYERLRASGETVTTSQPSVGDFVSAYEPLLAEGRDVVSVHISAGISGTHQSALQAREQLIKEEKGGERIHVCDSRTAAGGTGMVLLTAARAAHRGLSAEEVSAIAEKAASEVRIWFSLDTLEYLRRGGRIGAAGAWLGATLKIKPVLTFREEVEPVERVRTRAKSVERLISYAKQRHEDGNDAWVVQHIQDPAAAERMVEACTPIFGGPPAYVSEVGPVLGAHAGPGMIGVGAMTLETLGPE